MRNSLPLLVVAVLVVALIVWSAVKNKKPEPEILPVKRQARTPPRVFFKDVTADAGIKFVHESGEYGDHLLPEIMGPGCGFLDFDSDGDQDIFIVNSGKWPHRHTADDSPTVTHSLYRNDGSGSFTDVGREMGLQARSYGQGVCFGDVDNDGFIDVFVTCVDKNVFYWNDRGRRFIDKTDEAGLGCEEWAVSAAFVDFDRDGLLDLFVGTYVEWSLEIQKEVHGKLTRKKLGESPKPPSEDETEEYFYYDAGTSEAGPSYGSYGTPVVFKPSHCRLYRNLGDLRFKDVSMVAGVFRTDRGNRKISKALAVSVWDYNGDGWPDIGIANDMTPNQLFRNSGKGRFTDVGAEAGTSTSTQGQARASMGLSWADYKNDGSVACAVSNFWGEDLALYHSSVQTKELFIDIALMEGVSQVSRPRTMWGVLFLDYDLDAWQDLFVACGAINSEDAELKNYSSEQPPMLFWNSGGTPQFRINAEDNVGAEILQPMVGRGAAYGDIDGDGDLDILVTSNRGPARLIRNEAPLQRNRLRVNLTGTLSNRSAIGAKVMLRTGGVFQRREVTSGSSYASQSELPITFGLAETREVQELLIIWPSGKEQRFSNVPINSILYITEDSATFSSALLKGFEALNP